MNMIFIIYGLATTFPNKERGKNKRSPVYPIKKTSFSLEAPISTIIHPIWQQNKVFNTCKAQLTKLEHRKNSFQSMEYS